MRIDKLTYATWMDTLNQSRQVMLEQGAFGLYRPNHDRVLHTVKPSELPDGSITKCSLGTLDFHDGLKEAITAFNTGRANHVEIGPYKYSKKDGKVYGYHTHPAGDHEVAPSVQDRTEMHDMAIPLEVILSGALLEHKPKMPFVLGYNPDYFPEGEREFSQMSLDGAYKLAKKLKIPIEILYQLVFLPHYTGLKASLSIARM